MLHTVLDLQSTQLVNSVTQLNVKLVKKKLKKKKLRVHSPKMHYFSTKSVQRAFKQMT